MRKSLVAAFLCSGSISTTHRQNKSACSTVLLLLPTTNGVWLRYIPGELIFILSSVEQWWVLTISTKQTIVTGWSLNQCMSSFGQKHMFSIWHGYFIYIAECCVINILSRKWNCQSSSLALKHTSGADSHGHDVCTAVESWNSTESKNRSKI